MPSSNGPEYARRAMAGEISVATRVHPSTARAHLEAAETLANDFPTTLSALEHGRISLRHAKVIADAGAELAASAPPPGGRTARPRGRG